jgi:hypothetical protein
MPSPVALGAAMPLAKEEKACASQGKLCADRHTARFAELPIRSRTEGSVALLGVCSCAFRGSGATREGTSAARIGRSPTLRIPNRPSL